MNDSEHVAAAERKSIVDQVAHDTGSTDPTPQSPSEGVVAVSETEGVEEKDKESVKDTTTTTHEAEENTPAATAEEQQSHLSSTKNTPTKDTPTKDTPTKDTPTKDTAVTEEKKKEKKKGKSADAKDKTQPSKADVAKAWTPEWDTTSQAYYWWNTITYETTWENPLGEDSTANPHHQQQQQQQQQVQVQQHHHQQQQQQQQQPSYYASYYYDYPPAGSSESAAAASSSDPSAIAPTTAPHSSTSISASSSGPLDSLLDKMDTQVRTPLDGTPDYSSANMIQTPYMSYFGTDEQYKLQAVFNAKTGKFQTSEEIERLHPDRMSIENRATRQMQYYFDVDAYMDERNRARIAGPAPKRPLTKKDLDRFKRQKHEKKMKRARDWLCD